MDVSAFTPGSALVVVVLIALAPFFAVMVTSFTKIVVVLSLLRNALGLQQVPPNVVLNGMALVLSVYVMYPTMQQMAAASGQQAVPSQTCAPSSSSIAPRTSAPSSCARSSASPNRAAPRRRAPPTSSSSCLPSSCAN